MKKKKCLADTIHTLLRYFMCLMLCIALAYEVQGQQEPMRHKVILGENLFRISLRYNVRLEVLRDWNNLENNEIREGQELIVGYDSIGNQVTSQATANEDRAIGFVEVYGFNERLERTEELDIAVKTLVKEMAEKETLLEQLQEALEAEKEFGELKTSIISNLSHEFKTPLTSIRSSAQLLHKMIEQNKINETSIKHTSRIQAAVSLLNDLLSRILLVEKREQPEVYTPHREWFDLKEFMEAIKEEININNGNRAVISYHEEYVTQEVNCDQKLLRLIITNLVSNACKFSKQDGKVDVCIATTDRYLKVKVQDEGIGMSEEDMQQIFYRFYRGHNVGSIEGTGIGMSITKRCLEALSGDVAIDSKLNHGTTFRASLPLLAEDFN